MQPISSAGPPRASVPSSFSPSTLRVPASAQALGRNPPSATDIALDTFCTRFDRLTRDDAGQRGFFLNLLL